MAPRARLSAAADAAKLPTLPAADAGWRPSATPRYTRIHGRWYDVAGFDHPGGAVALSLGVGRDATLLFRSSHAFTAPDVLDAVLARLEVPPAGQAALNAQHVAVVAAEGGDGLFDIAGGSSVGPSDAARVDAFEAEVKALAAAHFRREAAARGVPLRAALKAPPRRWLAIAVLAAVFVAAAVALVRGHWLALLVAPTACWLWMVNFWHDAAHFAMSPDWRVNAALTYAGPWFSSPLIWYHQHVIGHHAYTNVAARDPDLYHAPAAWRFNRGLRWRPLHAWQTVTTPLMWSLSVWTLLVLKPLVALRAGVLNRAVVLRRLPAWRVAAHLGGRALVLASLHAWPWFAFPGQPLKAAVFAVVPIGVFSLWFMACSQVRRRRACRVAGTPRARAGVLAPRRAGPRVDFFLVHLLRSTTTRRRRATRRTGDGTDTRCGVILSQTRS